MRFIYFLGFVFTLFVNSNLQSKCNFKTANHIDDLRIPSKIIDINVEIKNQRKWAVNALKIYTDKKGIIRDRFKKKVLADIVVNYDFGICKYKAKIRQHGDHKDHIAFLNGNFFSSLDVNLIDGNIASSTKFKLFLPSTRYRNSEILGTMILSNLGFLAPRTSLIDAKLNGNEIRYLFQEKVSKEMLELNGRREGPLFEGDEELLWNYKKFKRFSLEPVSLSRLINKKWSKKNISSFMISINSFLRLQKAYLNFGSQMNIFDSYLSLDKESNDNSLDLYDFLLLAMNGEHGLRPHNRKFYFNSLKDTFEPIYYDGNLQFGDFSQFDPNSNKDLMPILSLISKRQIEDLKNKIEALKINGEFIGIYSTKTKMSYKNAKKEIIVSLDKLIDRMVELKKLKNVMNHERILEKDFDYLLDYFSDFSRNNNLDQKIYEIDLETKEQKFLLKCLSKFNCNDVVLDHIAISNIMSSNEYNKLRSIIVKAKNEKIHDRKKSLIQSEIGLIEYSSTGEVIVMPDQKFVILKQNTVNDWFLFKGPEIKDWTIKMIGVNDQNKPISYLSEFGLTGCLTFYSVNFFNTNIHSTNGYCEDAVNIINGSGKINSIKVENSVSDGVDFDFSKLNINFLDILNAGNDCSDFSYGFYKIQRILISNCNDKGISIGETSNFELESAIIKSSTIGVASKDSSLAKIDNLVGTKVKTCLSAYKKKQEFGGADLSVKNLKCSGSIYQDSNSIIDIGNNLSEF